ncbi:acyltransferase family protein [Streptomyces monticola]|uniref:Acyltransferase family protein n=1 Tax=Streptomyces monticola TaxID=2666263 RepID=A0ABW2JGF6_9ACTN
MTTDLAAFPAYGRRLDSLTGLRFLAAALVFFSHFVTSGLLFGPEAPSGMIDLAGRSGGIAVGFFFVLSGFVLTYSSRPGDTASHFWLRRFAKIYPTHAIAWIISVLLVAWAGEQVLAAAAGSKLLLFHGWIPHPSFINNNVNPVSWSLCCEALFYALFPWLLRALRRIPADGLWWAAGLTVALIFSVPVVAQFLPAHPLLPPPLPAVSFHQAWFVYLFPPVRVLDFVLGILLARIVLEGRWIRLGLTPAGLIAVAGFLGMLKVPTLFSMTAATVIPCALIICSAADADRKGRRSLLRTGVMVWLGEISFALYMTHWLVFYAGSHVFGLTRFTSGAGAFGVIAYCVVGSLAVAVLMYRCVEMPIMRVVCRPAGVVPNIA